MAEGYKVKLRADDKLVSAFVFADIEALGKGVKALTRQASTAYIRDGISRVLIIEIGN